jgi:hypothetical protein
METLEEVKFKYYNLLIYSLQTDYKNWTAENIDSKTEYIICKSPKYGNLRFEFKEYKGIFVRTDYHIYSGDIRFKSYNPWCKRRKLQRRMLNYLKNKDIQDKLSQDIKRHEDIIKSTEKELNKNKDYIQYNRSSKLKRITGEK